jgi:hypothetical protein
MGEDDLEVEQAKPAGRGIGGLELCRSEVFQQGPGRSLLGILCV